MQTATSKKPYRNAAKLLSPGKFRPRNQVPAERSLRVALVTRETVIGRYNATFANVPASTGGPTIEVGRFRHTISGPEAANEMQIYAVIDYTSKFVNFEAGVRFGLTSSSDKVTLKLMPSHDLR